MTEFEAREGPFLVIGSAGLDVVVRARSELRSGTSNPGVFRVSPGGVARNLAENLARLGEQVILLTAVGDDDQGNQILDQTEICGVDISHVIRSADHPTGSYLAILDSQGRMHLGMDDMSVISTLRPENIEAKQDLFDDAAAVFVDANLSEDTLRSVIKIAHEKGVPIAADPTSANLAPVFCNFLDRLWLVVPNESEAEVLCPHPVPHANRDQAIDAARHLISEGVDIAIVTMAEFGVGYASADGSGHVPALKTEIVDPTGAGDAFTAAVIFALHHEIPLDEAILLGVSAASLTLRTSGTVAPDLSLERLYDALP
ncbi:MAG: carbohydrate kinase family protein [Anaerolineales bacterium]|jgi:pseudouridine kinase